MAKSGSINGVPFGYIKKAVKTTIRNAKSETPGKYGSEIDQMKEGGADITLDVIAQSPEERDTIVAAFMQEGRGIFKPGTPDADWHYTGVCGDRSSDFALSQYNPSVAYPLSFLFQTDLPFQLSNEILGHGKLITGTNQKWSAGDNLPFNTIQNWNFESWTDYSTHSVLDGWIRTSSSFPSASFYTAGTSPYSVDIASDGSKYYVANGGDNTVSVFDSTNAKTATITGFNSPYAVVISPDGLKAYVANHGTNTVSVVTLSSNTITNTITVGSAPWSIVFKPDGSKAYVSNNSSTSVSIIDCSTETVSDTVTVGTTPSGMALSTDVTKLYVANYGSNNVSVITLSDNTVSTIAVGTNPYSVSIYGTKAYVTNYTSQNISVINTSTGAVSSTISISKHPIDSTLSSDGSKLYVACVSENCIIEIDTGSETVIRTGNVYEQAYAVKLHGHSIYVASQTHVVIFSPVDILRDTFKSDSVHKYGLYSAKIVNKNSISRCGEWYQSILLESGVEYTFGVWGYTENYAGGHIIVELWSGNDVIASCGGEGYDDFTLVKDTYTFESTPNDISLHFSVQGSPDDTGFFYLGGIFCIKSDDFSETMNFAGFIETSGTVSTVPDIQIDAPKTNENIQPLPTNNLIYNNIFYKNIIQQHVSDSTVYSQAYVAPRTASSDAVTTQTFLSPSSVSDNSTVTHAWDEGNNSTTTLKTTTINGVTGYSIVLVEVIYDITVDTFNGMTHYLTANGGDRGNVWWHDYGYYHGYHIALGNPEVGKNDFNFSTACGQGCTLALQMSNPTSTEVTASQTNLMYVYRFKPTTVVLLKTITIDAVAGETHILTYQSCDVKTSSANNPAHIYVKYKIGNGTETDLVDGNTTSTDYYNMHRNENINAGVGNAITLNFYGIMDGDLGGIISIRNCRATYETTPVEVCLATVPISAVLNKTQTLTSYGYQLNTSNSSNAAVVRVTIETDGLGNETQISTWSTTATTPSSQGYNTLSYIGQTSTAITLRFYCKLANGSGGTVYIRNCEAYYGTSEDYYLITTLEVPGTSTGVRRITEYGYSTYTTDSRNACDLQVRIQNPHINSGNELAINTWSTNSTTKWTDKKVTSQNLEGNLDTTIYLRLYGKLDNGGLGTLNLTKFYCVYSGGYSIPSGIPQNIQIYNTEDPATVLKFCNRLPLGCSMRVNWDSTGFYRHIDNYSTNSYLSVYNSSASSGVGWDFRRLTIYEKIVYDFDVKFPIDGTPYILIGVVSGVPQISIALIENGVTGTYCAIDGNLTSASATTYILNLINQSNCVLKEQTNFSIKITPLSGSCVINFFALFTDLFTVDAERPLIYPKQINEMCLTMTEEALCTVSMAYNNRKWGI